MSDGGGGSGRPPDSAAFEPARVGGPRRARPPVLGAAFVIALVAVVGAGLSGRLGAGSFPKDVAIGPTGEPEPSPTSPVGRLPALVGPSDLPAFPADTGPIYTSAPGPIALQAKRHPQTIFVHGDVDAKRITWVYVGVLDDAGRVAGWTSVSVPGSVGANRNGPTMRFDVELAIPADFEGRLWVRAQAYGSDGKVIASTNVEVPAGS